MSDLFQDCADERDQLYSENEELKAEVERLTGNLKSLEERFNIGFQNFTLERQISAMLREALEVYAEVDESFVSLFKVVLFRMKIGNMARYTLAREKEMRK